MPDIKIFNMKSRITIEVDFDNGNKPFIQLSLVPTNDVRDKLLESFIETLAHQSSWCKISFKGGDLLAKWAIEPISFEDLPEQCKLMQAILKK